MYRKPLRLKNHDYSGKSMYFVTICTQNRIHYFGEVLNNKLVLNDAGRMIEKWYWELENKFIDIKCHQMIVMPDHFHAIIENIGRVGVDLIVCPIKLNNDKFLFDETGKSGEHKGSPLYLVIQWFKTMTTNEYIREVKNSGWKRFNGKLWQRNYWEHIIRDEISYARICNYIVQNPVK